MECLSNVQIIFSVERVLRKDVTPEGQNVIM